MCWVWTLNFSFSGLFEVEHSRKSLRAAELHREIKQQFLVEEPEVSEPNGDPSGQGHDQERSYSFFNIHEFEHCEFDSQGQTTNAASTCEMNEAPLH